jgi:hypothetical protein
MVSLSEAWEIEMSKAKSKQRAPGELSSRQREWLEHLKECKASGEPMKEYAKRHLGACGSFADRTACFVRSRFRTALGFGFVEGAVCERCRARRRGHPFE